MIAIPNMEKPKNCMDCIVEEYADCDVWKGVVSASKYKDRRYEHCPIIEIDDEIWEALKPKVETMSLAEKGWITDDSNTYEDAEKL